MEIIKKILFEIQFRHLAKSNRNFDCSQYKEFETDEEADLWGRSLCGDWHSKFLELLSAMRAGGSGDPFDIYFGFGCVPINQILRGVYDWKEYLYENSFSEEGERAAAKRLVEKYMQISLMLIGFYLAPNTDRNIVVYRKVPNVVVRELLQNAKYEERGFLGTSLIKERCVKNCGGGKHLLKIYVPNNTRAIYANVVSARDEWELLFSPNATLQLLKKPYIDSVSNVMVYEVKLSYGGQRKA